MEQSVSVKVGVVLAGVVGSLGSAVVPSQAAGTTVQVVTDPQVYEQSAGGRAVIEDFTDDEHFPILSCRLSSGTREEGLQPGDIEPGVVYSTHCSDAALFELNIDGGSFEGGFLDGFHHGERFDKRALRVRFTEPVRAFGFDTNELMGRTFKVRIIHSDGRVQVIGGLDVSAGFFQTQFFGFVSDAADIERVRILGNGNRTFGFALDNFRFNPAT